MAVPERTGKKLEKDEEEGAFFLSLHNGDEHPLLLKATSEEERDSWISSIRQCAQVIPSEPQTFLQESPSQ